MSFEVSKISLAVLVSTSALPTLSVEAPLVSVLCLWLFKTARLLWPILGSWSVGRKAPGQVRTKEN